MCEKSVELKCSWQATGGNGLKSTLIVLLNHRSNLKEGERPPSDEIMDVNRTILLNNENNAEKCELNVSTTTTNFIINSFNLIISGSKILEIFVGNEEEYYGTFHGEFVDDSDGIIVYRYDVRIGRPKTRKFLIKFLNPEKDLWIYGLLLHISQCNDQQDIPAMLNSTRNIDYENVQNILSNSNYKLSSNAEKCKKFLENYMTTKSQNTSPPNMQMLLSLVNPNFKDVNLITSSNGNCSAVENNINTAVTEHEENKNCDKLENSTCDTEMISNQLTKLIENKFLELKNHVDTRLDRIEKEQNEKFDRILWILENRKIHE